MGAFDEAVHEAANAVKPFMQALDDSHRECLEGLRYVQALTEALKEDRQALDEMVEAMVKDVKDAEEMLSGVTADATSNLGLVKEVVDEATPEWEEVFHAEETALTGGADMAQLSEHVKELADKAEAATQAVLEWVGTVSHELDQAVDSVEQAVGVGLASLVADWKRTTEAAANKLVESFENQWPDGVSEKETQWREKIAETYTMLTYAFDLMAEHNQRVVDFTKEKWEELKAAQMKFTTEDAQKLVGELNSLTQAAVNYESTLGVAGQMVGENQQQAAEAASHLAQALLEVRGLWSTYGITC